MRKKQLLKITLKSDLCAGSGFAFAGVIDADVQYDRYGIPCISGRSLKGCLRESAVTFLELNNNALDQLFGVGGSDQLTGIQIGNADPEGAQQLRDEIDALSETYKGYIGTQNILAYYTNVRAQTSIDAQKGSAKENTLRFTRVVNHYVNDQEMVFYAPIEYDLDDASENTLKNIVKATRHIGSNRSRGLGNVMMKLVPSTEEQDAFSSKKFDASKKQKITFCVKNIAPLMLSQSADSSTESYIGGNLVLGALAGRYLSMPSHSADDPAFKALFLSEETQYSNLTLAAFLSEDGEEKWVASEPVPAYIMRRKKTRDYVNIFKKNEAEDEKKEIGNQPKKAHNRWLFRNDKGQPIKIAEVERDIVYHHAKHKENSKGKEGLLYYFESIAPGQYFAGDIIVDGCYAELMLELLKMGDFHFGKSRTAQYGTCRIVDIDICNYEPKEDIYGEREQIVVTFLSDAIFTDQWGNDVVKGEIVKNIVADTIEKFYMVRDEEHGFEKGCANSSDQTEARIAPYDFVMTKVITGYNTKWNLQRPQRIGIKAGSAFIFQLEDDAEIKEGSVGENKREGFGRFRVDKFDEMEYDVPPKKKKSEDNPEEDQKDQEEIKKPEEAAVVSDHIKPILKESIRNALYKSMLQPVFDGKLKEVIPITASALGRLTLMLTEVQNEERDALKRFEALEKRIDSFKDDEKLKAIKEFTDKILGKSPEEVVLKLTQLVLKEYEMLQKLIGDEEAEREVFALWPQYLNAVLTSQKYRMKEAAK